MNEEEYRPRGLVKKPTQNVLSVGVARVVRFCREAIREYSLDVFLKEAKTLTFETLSAKDKEKFCAGMIKLGEALTYCRDSSDDYVQNTGICEHAIKYVRVRNHFVHYHVYHDFVNDYKKLNEYIQSVQSIKLLEASLASLEKCGIEMLSKEIRSGSNDFKFEFSRFLMCLKRESLLLREIMLELKGHEKIPLEKKISLENRVRNILVILVDLLDEKRDGKRNNTNFGDPCELQKQFVATLNEKYKKERASYKDFFDVLKAKRNLFCHLETDEKKPYANDKEQLEFAEGLDDLLKKGYVEALEKELITTAREVPKIEILGPVEIQRKLQTKVKLPIVVAEIEAVKPKISGLDSLKKAYNTPKDVDKASRPESKDVEKPVAEPEKKKEKKGSPGGSPRMGV